MQVEQVRWWCNGGGDLHYPILGQPGAEALGQGGEVTC